MFARILLDVGWRSSTLLCDVRASRTKAMLSKVEMLSEEPRKRFKFLDEKYLLNEVAPGCPSILPFAVFVGNTGTIKFLVQAGISLTEPDHFGCDLFHYVRYKKGISIWNAEDLMTSSQVDMLSALYQS